MSRRPPISSALACFFALLSPSLDVEAQQIDRAVVERGKSATALVEADQPGGKIHATAFCVDASGLFVTNAHVVEKLRADAPIKLIVRSGLKDQRELEAKVFRFDSEVDLALLTVAEMAGAKANPAGKAVGKKPDPAVPSALSLGRDDEVFETVQTITLGFPLGRDLALKEGGYPNVAVNINRVSSTRQDQEGLAAILFDGQILPGNSGGPVLNVDGRVIGVARATIIGGSINLAIPAGRLARFLGSPTLMFEPPPLNWLNQSNSTTWTIRPRPARPSDKLPEGASMVIRVTTDGRTREVAAGRAPDGSYRATLVPFPAGADSRAATKREIKVDIELKSKGEVLASTHRRTEIGPLANRAADPMASRPALVGRDDKDFLKVVAPLAVDGVPLGSVRAIRPPAVAIGTPLMIRGDRESRPGGRARIEGSGSVIAFSPDGTRLLVGGRYGSPRLVDARTGAEVRKFAGHSGVEDLAYSPDGRLALSAGTDGTARLWDVDDGKQRQVMTHAGVATVAFSPDGRLAATGGTDKAIRLWDVATGREVGQLQGHLDGIGEIAFSPDGRTLASSCLASFRTPQGQVRLNPPDRTVRVWDVATRATIRTIEDYPGVVRDVAFSPDGKIIALACTDATIRLFDVATGEAVGLMTNPGRAGVESIAFSPDGRTLYSSSSGPWERAIRTWDVAARREVDSPYLPQQGSSNLAISADGRWLASAGLGAELWEVSRQALAVPGDPLAVPGDPLAVPAGGKIGDVAVGGGGRYLFLTLRDQKRLAVFDINSAAIVKSIPLPSDDVRIAAGSKVLVIADPERRLVERWDLATMAQGGPTVPSPIQGRILALAMGHDSDGPLLAAWLPDVARDTQPRISFLDPVTLGVLGTESLSSRGMTWPVGLSPSGGSFTLQPFSQGITTTRRIHARASAGGDLFTAWHGRMGGFVTLSIRGGMVASNYVGVAENHAAPGPDGRTIFTGKGSRLDPSGRVREGFQGPGKQPEMLAVPSPEPGYYLTVDRPPATQPGGDRDRPNQAHGKPASATIRDDLEGEPLATILNLTELAGAADEEHQLVDDFSFEKRIHFVPSARLLATIPTSNDRIVLRRVDLDQVLAGNAGDWLVVISPRLLRAEVGVPFRHQVEIKVGRGKPQFSIGNGPAGLTIAADGMIDWPSPAQAEGGDEAALAVNVLDGANRIHAVPIRIQVR